MQNFRTIIYLMLPSVLCFIIIISTQLDIAYYPLFFGLVLGLVNWKKFILHPVLGLVLILICSYFSFFVAYFSMPAMSEIFRFIGGDNATKLAFFVGPNIIAPLLVFYTYKIAFNYHLKTKFGITVMVGTVLILGLVFYVYLVNVDQRPKAGLGRVLTNPYTWWQVILAFSLQLMIHKDQVKIVFLKPKYY